MAGTIEITLPDGRLLPVTVTRKRVRNLNLRVRSDGSVVMSIPLRTSEAFARRFLESRAAWIAERVRRRSERDVGEDAPVPLSGPDAGTIPLWGELVDAVQALGLEDGKGPGQGQGQGQGRGPGQGPGQGQGQGPRTFGAFISAGGGRAGARASGEAGAGARCDSDDEVRAKADGRPDNRLGVLSAIDPAELQTRIDALYRREIILALPEIARCCEDAMGVRATRWAVRRMKTRWGSCTPRTGAIRINSTLAAYPPECLEMVVAHELVHLMEASHNQRFHALLDRYCPRNRKIGALLGKSAREAASCAGRRAS